MTDDTTKLPEDPAPVESEETDDDRNISRALDLVAAHAEAGIVRAAADMAARVMDGMSGPDGQIEQGLLDAVVDVTQHEIWRLQRDTVTTLFMRHLLEVEALKLFAPPPGGEFQDGGIVGGPAPPADQAVGVPPAAARAVTRAPDGSVTLTRE